MPLEFGQEPLDGHGHELGSAEGGHVAEDVGRVSRCRETSRSRGASTSFGGDLVEDACGEVVVAEELLIAFEGASDKCCAGFEIKAIWTADVGFDGLLSVPVEEVEEDQRPRRQFGRECRRDLLKCWARSSTGMTSRMTWRKTP